MFNKEAVLHMSYGIYAYQKNSTHLVLIIRIKKNDANKVSVIYGDPYELVIKNKELPDSLTFLQNINWVHQNIEMKKWLTTENYDYYKAIITNRTKRLMYYFIVNDRRKNEGNMVFGCNGFKNYNKMALLDCFNWAYLCEGNVNDTPNWVNNTIWYHIFVERFKNGDKSNDPKNTIKWESKEPTWNTYYGGDLQGIIRKLDYLEDLGITGICLTPIFKANSNHKYNTIDYFEIDGNFGNERTFKLLIVEARKRNIRIMLDGVFNHIGSSSLQWQDILMNKEKSKYANWFRINDFKKLDNVYKAIKYERENFKVNYPFESFAFSPWMPKFNWENPEVQKFLLDVIKKWTGLGIDDWRLDVSSEISISFLRKIRQCIKSINPDVYIIGEVMYGAQKFLNGDMFDAVMNYTLRNYILRFILNGQHHAKTFISDLSNSIVSYTQPTQEVMFNIIDSHDKGRVLTITNNNINKHLLSYQILFILSGSPSIYYGAEIALPGGEDPLNRRCMIWDKNRHNKKSFQLFKKLIKIRKENLALRKGEYKITLLDGNVIYIKRFLSNNVLHCYINNSSKQKSINICEGQLNVILNGEIQNQQLLIPPYSVSILK